MGGGVGRDGMGGGLVYCVGGIGGLCVFANAWRHGASHFVGSVQVTCC